MLVSILSRLIGIAMIPIGLFLMLLVLGFAMLIGPGFEGAAWWAEYWDNIVRGGGLGHLGFGLLLVIFGVLLLIAPIDQDPRWSPKTAKLARDDFD